MSSQVAVSSDPVPACAATEERRAFPRYPVDWEVVCKALAGGRGDSWKARLRDVSAGGIGVVLERRFERGTTLTVQLQNGSAEAPRTLLARVMHATRLPEGEWLLGLSLLRQLSEEQLQAWGVGPVRPESPDYRAWVRVACDMDALCREVGVEGAAPWRVRVLNLSPRGIGLAAPCAVAPGAHLTVDLPGVDGLGVRQLLVRVAQVTQQEEEMWLLGCEFAQQLSEADLSALQFGEVPTPETVPEPAPSTPTLPAEWHAGVEPTEPAAAVPETDPDLDRVCAAWPGLPPHLRAAILALVGSAP